jgi:hypothetical protein
MRRREYIRPFSSNVVAWPLAARAQQAATPGDRVSQVTRAKESGQLVAAVRQVQAVFRGYDPASS